MLDWNGLLPVYKPRGMISMDVARWFKKRWGRLKIGHVGTLDPMADGILPLVFGRATPLQDTLLAIPKTYEFEVAFGFETDTLDSDGQIVATCPVKMVSEESLRTACLTLTGEIMQTPPLYSAVKFQGRPLYNYARSDQADLLDRQKMARRVQIYSCDLLAVSADKAIFRATCSKGTYVRVLAQQMATMVGTLATVVRLTRTHAAGVDCTTAFRLGEAENLSLDKLLAVIYESFIPLEQIRLAIPQGNVHVDSAYSLEKGFK